MAISDHWMLKNDYENRFNQCFYSKNPLKKFYKNILVQLNIEVNFVE
jgi:hypothetical protein